MLRGFQVFVSGMAVAAVMLVGVTAAQAQDAAAQPAAPVLALEGDAAIVTILIKPDKTADFESVLNKLKESLAKSEKPERKQQAAGWRIFKGTQPGPQNSVVYLMRIDPVVKGQEYDISRLIAEVFPVEVQEVFAKYKEAFAGRVIMYLKPHMSMQ